MYSTWIGEANSIIRKIKETNKAIDTCIDEIKSDVEVVDNIVKFVGLLDKAVNIAAGLVI